MSAEKNIAECQRWLKTAEDDLDTARILRKENKYAHACFHAQQAGEKALKAVWYLCDADPWGHSIKKLVDDLEEVDLARYHAIRSLSRDGQVLDRFYIPTRYPNGLPDMTPDEAFSEEDVDECIKHAEKIVTSIKKVTEK